MQKALRLVFVVSLVFAALGALPQTARADWSTYLRVSSTVAQDPGVTYTWTATSFGQSYQAGDRLVVRFGNAGLTSPFGLAGATAALDGVDVAKNLVQVDSAAGTVTITLPVGVSWPRATTHAVQLRGIGNPSPKLQVPIDFFTDKEPTPSTTLVDFHGAFASFVLGPTPLPQTLVVGQPGPEFTVTAVDQSGIPITDFAAAAMVVSDDPHTSPDALTPQGLSQPLVFVNGVARCRPIFFAAATERRLSVVLLSAPTVDRLGQPYTVAVTPGNTNYTGWTLAASPAQPVKNVPFAVTLTQVDAYGNPTATDTPADVTLVVPNQAGDQQLTVKTDHGVATFSNVTTDLSGDVGLTAVNADGGTLAVLDLDVSAGDQPSLALNFAGPETATYEDNNYYRLEIANVGNLAASQGVLTLTVQGTADPNALTVTQTAADGKEAALTATVQGNHVVFQGLKAVDLAAGTTQVVDFHVAFHVSGMFILTVRVQAADGTSWVKQSVVTYARQVDETIVLPDQLNDLGTVPWATAEIQEMAQIGIVKGVAPGTFAPQASITRAQFATLLVRLLDLSPVEDAPQFADVAQGDWYYEAVSTAAAYGVVQGSGSQFFPNRSITREEMAVMIARAAKLSGMTTDISAGSVQSILSDLNDHANVSAWAENGVAFAIARGLIQGRAEDTFVPQGLATRAEATVVLARLYHQMP